MALIHYACREKNVLRLVHVHHLQPACVASAWVPPQGSRDLQLVLRMNYQQNFMKCALSSVRQYVGAVALMKLTAPSRLASTLHKEPPHHGSQHGAKTLPFLDIKTAAFCFCRFEPV
jgi:hypothetical protein